MDVIILILDIISQCLHVSAQPVVHFKYTQLYLPLGLQSRGEGKESRKEGKDRGMGVSLLSGGSEFVQKGGTLFTVGLRTLAEASSKGRPHLQVTWVPVRKEWEEPCLEGRAGLPPHVNLGTR